METNYHISKDEFISRFATFKNNKCSTIKNYERIYNSIIRGWDSPTKWLNDENKYIGKFPGVENNYWCIWSLLTGSKLPPDFIKSMKRINAQEILRNTLIDYSLVCETINKMKKSYQKTYIDSMYSLIVLACTYSGVNAVERLNFEIIMEFDEVIKCGYISKAYRLLDLRYQMGYENSTAHDKIFTLKKEKKVLSDLKWSIPMLTIKEQFLCDMENSYINKKMKHDKRTHLDYFAQWYIDFNRLDVIKELKTFNRATWIDYIKYTVGSKVRANKTNGAILVTIVQFYEWLVVKFPEVLGDKFGISNKDFSQLSNYQSSSSLAFEQREHGERILDYLINNFDDQDVTKRFMREAIIIAANSGLRYSEISNLRMGCCFWSEDENCYKLVIDYIDKMRQKNRPVYITKLGFEALKRAESLRNQFELSSKRENYRADEDYIYIFEHRGRKIIYHHGMYTFLNDIKIKLGLVNKEGEAVRGGVHAYRHFFAMTLFKESGYNISVVRFLLGHKSYTMTNKYLEEEKERVTVKLREGKDLESKMFAGGGLNSIIDFIFSNKNTKEYIAIKNLIENSVGLDEFINGKTIKKLPIGYCINPCEKEKKCYKCNRFLVETSERTKLLQFTRDTYEILSYKISLFESVNEALKEQSIVDEIQDIDILFKELRNLGFENEKIVNTVLKEVR